MLSVLLVEGILMEQAEGRLVPGRVFQLAQRKPSDLAKWCRMGDGESGKYKVLRVTRLCWGTSINALASLPHPHWPALLYTA